MDNVLDNIIMHLLSMKDHNFRSGTQMKSSYQGWSHWLDENDDVFGGNREPIRGANAKIPEKAKENSAEGR